MPRLSCLLALFLLLLSARTSAAQPPQTIQDLSTPWLVHVGDDPRFSSPTFDDSRWTPMPLGKLFAGHLAIPRHGGVFWARLHLHDLSTEAPMGLALTDSGALPFTLYLNGAIARRNPASGADQERRVPPFTTPLPPARDVVVAFRFTWPSNYTPTRFPITAVTLGPLENVSLQARLNALIHFDDTHVAEIVGIGLFAGLGVFAWVLYLLQRSRSEYLFLALFCVGYSITAVVKILVETGSLPESDPVMLVYRYIGCLSMVASLEFVSRFSQVRWRPADRLIETLFLIAPLIGQFNQFFFNITLVLCFALLFAYMCACFLSAMRQGVAETRLLLPFLALLVLVDTAYYASYLSPRLSGLPRLHLGTVGIGAEDLTVITFIAGIMTVVLYRFNRINREEQHTLSEFRAARRLQQALIPEQPPAVPGFHIATAYHPAQEVGGDFFQILPLPCSSGVLVAIGDVSGKGLEAAMAVAVIIGALRSLAEYTDSPAALMTSLNRRLLDRGAGFCTCTVIRLDPFGHGVVASAGHLSPYLDGEELEVDAGLPLGLVAEATYTETTLHCRPGQQLTLVTDGVVEACNTRSLELFGFDRTRALSRSPAGDIAKIALAFGHGATASDDITVLTLAIA